MFISAIIAAHIATGIVKATNDLKNIDEVFSESFIKYAQIDTVADSKENIQMNKIRKEYPDVITWKAKSCNLVVKGTLYAIYAVKGFFTLLPTKKDRDMTTDEYVKYIREQHPKIKQGIIS